MINTRVIAHTVFFLTAITPAFLHAEISLRLISSYESGIFDDSALEIADYDSESKRIFAVNGNKPSFEIIDITDPATPTQLRTIDISKLGSSANSVAVANGIIAVAVEAHTRTDNGKLAFYDIHGEYLKHVTVGSLPDMVAITPNGKYALVANEAEPNADYSLDPEASISIVPISGDITSLTDADVKNLDFRKFNATPPSGLRIGKPGASVAQDVEPEYIAISADSNSAWVTLQENNAIAVVDVRTATIETIIPLGYKNHNVGTNALDANPDENIDIRPWPVLGLYQPDAITSLNHNGATYWLTANEGDSREYGNFIDEIAVAKLNLDPNTFPNAAALQSEEQIGSLTAIANLGDTDGDGDHDIIHTFGARSFSVWDNNGKLIYDSGSDFERITATRLPNHFNVSNDANGPIDKRSGAKGPEPEGLTIGSAHGKTLAFIGLERVGGVMIFNLSNPIAPTFEGYTNHRDFGGDPEVGLAGPLGPEGLVFIPAHESPNGNPLLIIVNEVSGSISITEVIETP